MNMAWIRKNYNVPARRGARVEYTGCGPKELGTITSVSGAYVNVRLDGHERALPFHPTWALRYLPQQARPPAATSQEA